MLYLVLTYKVHDVLNIFLQYQSEPPVIAPAFTDTASALCSLSIIRPRVDPVVSPERAETELKSHVVLVPLAGSNHPVPL